MPKPILIFGELMPEKKKASRTFVDLPFELSEKLEVISKVEGKNKTDLLLEAVKGFVPGEIEKKEIDKEALYMFLDSKLSFKELSLIIGKEKAKAAKYTRDIRNKGKEFLDTLEK